MVKQCNKNRADVLGDRMKSYESLTTNSILMPNTPVYARIDGRAFHTLTKGLQKPFDPVFNTIMDTVCAILVDNTGAILGYRQSDEISLGWENSTKAPFEGKIFKLQSILSSMATAGFYTTIANLASNVAIKEKIETEEDEDVNSLVKIYSKSVQKPVCFDCRIFNVPSMEELANAFLWREHDAIRNSIQGLAQANFSHKSLQGKSCEELKQMLASEGKDWDKLPMLLKRGMYIKKQLVFRDIEDEVWNKIPDDKKPDSRQVVRTELVPVELPFMRKVINKVGVYFYEETPYIETF